MNSERTSGAPSELSLAFDDPALGPSLDGLAPAELDRLGFGLIVMDREGTVTHYNDYESTRAGIARDRVLGRNFFLDVGPCTNNYLVAERYVEAGELDETIDYVFTFRMRPTPVRLRMLAQPGAPRQYLAVVPR